MGGEVFLDMGGHRVKTLEETVELQGRIDRTGP
jgi:hypothetical protein